MSYSQFTLDDLLTQFYQQVGGNTRFFRRDEAIRILQESFRVFNVLTGFWRGRIDMGTTVAGEHWYTVPSSMSYILRVEVNGRPLASSSLYDLDYGQPNWEAEVVSPTGQIKAFAPAGANLFALWPASLTGEETLLVEGVVPAPVLTAGPVDLGQDSLEMILDYAEHIAQFKEGGQEFEASQLGLKEFLKEAGDRNGVLRQSAKFRKFMGLTDEKKRPMRMPDAQVGAR
jgi:hypothetical protein